MPTIKEATQLADESVYERVEVQNSPIQIPPIQHGPLFNPMLRCPLPVGSGNPDNLRQFYRDSIPQARIMLVL